MLREVIRSRREGRARQIDWIKRIRKACECWMLHGSIEGYLEIKIIKKATKEGPSYIRQRNDQRQHRERSNFKIPIQPDSLLILIMEQKLLTQYHITKSQLAIAEDLLQTLSTLIPHTQKQSAFYLTLPNLIRFAIARDFHQKDTTEMFLNWVKWYESFRPDLIPASQMKNYHDTGKVRVLGHDRDGCPIFWIRMRYGVKGSADGKTILRYMIYMIEQAIAKTEELGHHQFTVVHDRLGDYQSEEESKEAMKQFSPILSDNYPERLHLYLVLGVNWFFRAAYKVVSVFMSRKTTDKVRILSQLAQLCEYIELKQQLTDYGGGLKAQCGREIPLKEVELNSEEVQKMREQLKK